MSKIEWTDFVSNPIKGQCRNNCFYCYAERTRKRFRQPKEISWHPQELFQVEQRKKPTTIFIGSMYDIFGYWVPQNYICWILDTAKNCKQHEFIFLTKNPTRLHDFTFPENTWIGITDDCDITKESPIPLFAKWKTQARKFISFEPLLGPLRHQIPADVGQIIIGAMTGDGELKPEKRWIEQIINASAGRKIFIKDNLLRHYQEFTSLTHLAWTLH